jgi:tetratricopeptide (TPR) repeat protein
MRFFAIALALVTAVATASAQRHKPATIDSGTPEGQLLQQIGSESDEAKKLALMEDFVVKNPKHEGTNWLYELMIAGYSKAGQFDKALEAGGKLIAADPDDVESAYACLQAAEAKKDAELVIKWSAITSTAARKLAESPKPADTGDAEEWARRVDYAKQVDVRTEYSLYATLLQVTDPKKKILLGDALEQRNPASQYLPQMADQRFLAYVQAGETAKGMAIADKAIEKGQASVEMLLAAADAERSRKQYAKSIALAKQAVQAAAAKPKPEGASDADWTTWKTQIASRAHWTAGISAAAQNQWAAADQELRAALPGIRSSRDMLAEALFYLGLSNYRIAEAGTTERARDALRFSQECAAIPGRFQGPATTNVRAIRARYHIK